MPTLYGHGTLGVELRYGQLNVKTLYMSAVTRQLSLVCLFHGPLYFRHLHPVSFPYEAGGCAFHYVDNAYYKQSGSMSEENYLGNTLKAPIYGYLISRQRRDSSRDAHGLTAGYQKR